MLWQRCTLELETNLDQHLIGLHAVSNEGFRGFPHSLQLNVANKQHRLSLITYLLTIQVKLPFISRYVSCAVERDLKRSKN
jgi:hypothetical protein